MRPPPVTADARTAGEGDPDDVTPLFGPAWVARRLGVTPATLRTWHHRYDLAPTGRTRGGHRRYSAADLERLDRMRELTTRGIGVAEAARLSHDDAPPPPSDRPGFDEAGTPVAHPAAWVEPVVAAADALDQYTAARIISTVLRAHGVVETWAGLIAPVLRVAGERFARTADGIQVEHILTESVRAALGDVVRQDRLWRSVPPVLIAAPDGEQHVLPQHALAAGLAELDRPSVSLGASVPAAAIMAAAARVGPAVIFLWSQERRTARRVDLGAVAATAGGTGPVVVLGGPGWSHRLPGWADAHVADLPTALRVCVDAASLPGRTTC